MLPIAFDRPAYLALLALIPPLWWLGRRSLAGLGRLRRWIALAFRSIVMALIIFALADAQYERRSEGLTAVYLLDQSLSIPAAQRQAMVEFVRKSIAQHRDDSRGDRYAVVVFGRDAEVEIPPVGVNEALGARVESLVDPDYTDLATAIQRAKAIFPFDSAKRIVVVSDGNQNIGSAYREARAAAESGVSIDVVPVLLEPRRELSVEKIDVPTGVRRGQPFDLRVVMQNEAPPSGSAAAAKAVKGRLTIVRKSGGAEETVAEEQVQIDPGKQVFTIPQQLEQADFYTYEARFQADDPQDDGTAQNNSATAFTHIRGKGQVLLIENFEKQGEFNFLVERLRAKDVEVTVTATDQLFSSLAELQRYDAVVLANVSRSSVDDADNVASFSDEQIEMLTRNTRELGCGLVMIGGPDTYGAGGWANTKLEEAMPVDFQIKSAKVVPVGALVLLMHGGEMPQGNYWQKKITAEAVKLLGPRDYCGLVQWNGVDRWMWGQTQGGLIRVGPNRTRMLATIDRLQIGDMPDFEGSMKLAAAGFARLKDAAVKHMIIISDGDPQAPTPTTVRAFIQQGAKVTTIAVGSHGGLGTQLGTTLQNIARQTGGKYYEVRNANALPKIYQREARRIARPLVYEPPNPMLPIVESPNHEMLRGVETSLPPLTGFVLTTLKQNPLVERLLRAPQPEKDENSTLLAAWTYGAGKAVALTTDAGSRWTSQWTGWDGYDKFYSQIVRWAMRPADDTGNLTVSADVREGKTQVVVTALDENDELVNDLPITAGAVGPDLKSIPIAIQQTAPGRYVGEFPSNQAGSYLIVVNAGAGKAPIRTGVNVGYSAEYRDRTTNAALLQSLAEAPAGGGPPGEYSADGLMKLASQAQVVQNPFRRDLPPAVARREIWPWLVVAGTCLFWGDVFVRRVQVNLLWLAPALARFRDWVLRREHAAPAPEVMSRLRSRKQEIDAQIEGRRAAARAARFEIDESTAEAAGAAPPPLETVGPQPPAGPVVTAKPTPPAEEQTTESYTERLLRAKRQARRDDDKRET
jgi:uncharacterized membrane protein